MRPPKGNYITEDLYSMTMRDKDYSDGMTQQEIADILGVTRNAVQQMERNIIRKIQRAFEKRGIKKEDYLGEMK